MKKSYFTVEDYARKNDCRLIKNCSPENESVGKKSFLLFLILAFLSVMVSFSFVSLSTNKAQAQTQSLKLYYIHTREKAEIVFKRDGKYDQDGLKKLNYFLRDWRRNEPTNMDPRLFDLIWTVYQLSGSKDYINVVSAYRSPATNSMLRSKSKNSGVAKSSQHVFGRAMDFYLPDVNLSKLRALGLQQESGGVGYYPTSGSPFVHLDVGSVRHWPRMSRKELMALFPDGKTMYIPSDGKALPGYAQAKANYQARNGAPIMMASLSNSTEKKGGFFSNLFGGKNKKDDNQQVMVASAAEAYRPPAIAIAPAIAAIDLPNKDAPLPIPSPLYEDEDEENADIIPSPIAGSDTPVENATATENKAPPPVTDDNSIAVAYANIPIPHQKPENPLLAAQNITAIPVPQPQPQPEQEPQLATNTAIAVIAAETGQENNNQSSNLVAALEPQPSLPAKSQTLQEKALEVDASDQNLASIITSSHYIAIPDDDEYNDEEEDYADIEDQEENGQNIAMLNNDNNKQEQNGIPFSAEQELLKLPDIVYASGLVKPNEPYKSQGLHGRAIDFQPIARIY